MRIGIIYGYWYYRRWNKLAPFPFRTRTRPRALHLAGSGMEPFLIYIYKYSLVYNIMRCSQEFYAANDPLPPVVLLRRPAPPQFEHNVLSWRLENLNIQWEGGGGSPQRPPLALAVEQLHRRSVAVGEGRADATARADARGAAHLRIRQKIGM